MIRNFCVGRIERESQLLKYREGVGVDHLLENRSWHLCCVPPPEEERPQAWESVRAGYVRKSLGSDRAPVEFQRTQFGGKSSAGEFAEDGLPIRILPTAVI